MPWSLIFGILALPIGIGFAWAVVASNLLGNQYAALSGVLAGAIVAVLELGVGIRSLTTGLQNDLIDIQKKRLEIEEKFPLEVQKLSLELQKLQEEVKRLEARIVSPSEDDVRLYAGFDLADPGKEIKERQRGRKS